VPDDAGDAHESRGTNQVRELLAAWRAERGDEPLVGYLNSVLEELETLTKEKAVEATLQTILAPDYDDLQWMRWISEEEPSDLNEGPEKRAQAAADEGTRNDVAMPLDVGTESAATQARSERGVPSSLGMGTSAPPLPPTLPPTLPSTPPEMETVMNHWAQRHVAGIESHRVNGSLHAVHDLLWPSHAASTGTDVWGLARHVGTMMMSPMNLFLHKSLPILSLSFFTLVTARLVLPDGPFHANRLNRQQFRNLWRLSARFGWPVPLLCGLWSLSTVQQAYADLVPLVANFDSHVGRMRKEVVWLRDRVRAVNTASTVARDLAAAVHDWGKTVGGQPPTRAKTLAKSISDYYAKAPLANGQQSTVSLFPLLSLFGPPTAYMDDATAESGRSGSFDYGELEGELSRQFVISQLFAIPLRELTSRRTSVHGNDGARALTNEDVRKIAASVLLLRAGIVHIVKVGRSQALPYAAEDGSVSRPSQVVESPSKTSQAIKMSTDRVLELVRTAVGNVKTQATSQWGEDLYTEALRMSSACLSRLDSAGNGLDRQDALAQERRFVACLVAELPLAEGPRRELATETGTLPLTLNAPGGETLRTEVHITAVDRTMLDGVLNGTYDHKTKTLTTKFTTEYDGTAVVLNEAGESEKMDGAKKKLNDAFQNAEVHINNFLPKEEGKVVITVRQADDEGQLVIENVTALCPDHLSDGQRPDPDDDRVKTCVAGAVFLRMVHLHLWKIAITTTKADGRADIARKLLTDPNLLAHELMGLKELAEGGLETVELAQYLYEHWLSATLSRAQTTAFEAVLVDSSLATNTHLLTCYFLSRLFRRPEQAGWEVPPASVWRTAGLLAAEVSGVAFGVWEAWKVVDDVRWRRVGQRTLWAAAWAAAAAAAMVAF